MFSSLLIQKWERDWKAHAAEHSSKPATAADMQPNPTPTPVRPLGIPADAVVGLLSLRDMAHSYTDHVYAMAYRPKRTPLSWSPWPTEPLPYPRPSSPPKRLKRVLFTDAMCSECGDMVAECDSLCVHCCPTRASSPVNIPSSPIDIPRSDLSPIAEVNEADESESVDSSSGESKWPNPEDIDPDAKANPVINAYKRPSDEIVDSDYGASESSEDSDELASMESDAEESVDVQYL